MNWVSGKYNITTIDLAGIRGTISWADSGTLDEAGYKVQFGDWTLKTRFSDMDDAKNALLKFARKKAEELLKALS